MNIISVSRRTDIPAFYGDWFIRRVTEGFARYANPFNRKNYELSLRPQDVLAFVFWSKNYEPFLKYLVKLEMNYAFYFHFTITALPDTLEHHTPSVNQAVDTFKWLADRYSPHHVIWRYDPIVFSTATPLEYHMEKFEEISCQLNGYTYRCVFSFVQNHYRKVKRQFDLLNRNTRLEVRESMADEEKALLDFMKVRAKERNISLYSCCQEQHVDSEIQKARCVDRTLLTKLYPHHSFIAKVNPTRKHCGCFKSVDIGAYDTCPHGCVYCYANVDKEKARRYHKNHCVTDKML